MSVSSMDDRAERPSVAPDDAFRRQKRLVRYRLTPWRFRWIMALYPPLLINSIRATEVSNDFRSVTVRLRKTWLNTNFNGAIFGGTVTMAFDPWLGVMFWQVLTHRGLQALVVNYALNVRFALPATSTVWIRFEIPEDDVHQAVARLQRGDKYVKSYWAEAKNRSGDIVATAEVVVYMRARTSGLHRGRVSF